MGRTCQLCGSRNLSPTLSGWRCVCGAITTDRGTLAQAALPDEQEQARELTQARAESRDLAADADAERHRRPNRYGGRL